MTEKTILYAFLIEAPGSTLGGPMFVVPASQQELEDKIRTEAKCTDAEVVIVPPEEWNPPKLKSVSQEELTAKFAPILWSVQQSMAKLGLPKMEPKELIKDGVVLPNPVTGKVFFIFKIKQAG